MKKKVIFNKTITTLILSSLLILFLIGCSSTKSTTSTDTTANENSQRGNFDPSAIYTTVLKDLVTAGTITQTQSDKVLAVVTKGMPQGAAGDKAAGSPGENPGTAPTDAGAPTDTPTGTDATKGTGTDKTSGGAPKNDRLSELVTSKVITQAQADTINEKVKTSMGNSQPQQN